MCQCPLGLMTHFYETRKVAERIGILVSMPSRADDSFLLLMKFILLNSLMHVSMPSRADDSFLQKVVNITMLFAVMCQCPLGLMTHFYVPLQKPRFYAVSRAYFCRYLSEYSDRSSFSCMFTIWTHLTRQIFPNPEFTIAQNYSSVILFFHLYSL